MITSIQNEQVKYWTRLHQRKYRERQQQFFIEGFHLVEEAYHSGWKLDHLIYTDAIETSLPTWCDNMSSSIVSDQVFKHIAKTVNPQGIGAIVNIRNWKKVSENYTLLIDAVQDPGNLGTLIRTADAAGFSKIVLGSGTVDLFNDKVIRATQGSLFHLPTIQNDLEFEINELRNHNATILASALHEKSIPFQQLDVEGQAGLIVGNEGAGVSDKYIQMADKLIEIPVYGQAESLNVSVAAGILMYHIRN